MPPPPDPVFSITLRAMNHRDKALGKLSHNLRTPLSVLHTTTSMLLNPKYQFTPDQMREQLERLRRNVELLNRMAGQLSDIVALGAGQGEREALDVNEALRNSISALDAIARDKGVVVNSEVGAGALRIRADRQQLSLLLQHLLVGAVDRGKNGDRVTIRSGARDRTAAIEIRESGAGIADADTADPGLFICRQVATTQDGGLLISPQAGAGSTITLTLPLEA